MERDTLTLTLHGLPAFNEDVDGEVFARKFFKFMQALAASDEIVNGGRRLKYLIDKLEKNTATAAVREQVVSEGPTPESGFDYFQRGADLIYHDRPEARVLPLRFVSYVHEIAGGAGQTFMRGEIKQASNDNSVRIDKNLVTNARRILHDIKRLSLGRIPPFSGKAHVSLDGTVVTLEGRGEVDKAVIILTAGGREIDCVVGRIEDEYLRKIWKRRCVVSGIGHYSGNARLPDYIEAVTIVPVPDGGNWKPWRGAFNAGPTDEDSWH